MRLIGTGSALPKKIVTNEMISTFLETGDSWIVPRTGIRSRHVISDENLEDLGAEAVRSALEMSGLKSSDIDFFIVSNVISEYITPGMSCIIAEKTGIACPMIDINCACAGFIYAMDIAETYFKAGKARNVLIACVEEPTRMASWKDRGTCVLFGDGAGAAVFTAGDKLLGTSLKCEPSVEKIWQTRSLEHTPYIIKEERDTPIQLKGREVFRFAVNACTKGVEELLSRAGISKDEVDYFLVHQANKRIIDAIAGYLEQPCGKFPSNIEDHGNSSSASCPILLDECNRAGLFKSGDILVFSAFGAGLVSGAAILEW